MSDIKRMTDELVKFRDERDWKQFHNTKELTIAMSIEVAELLEHFRYKTPEQVADYMAQNKEEVSDELADVLYHVLLLAYDEGIDLEQALMLKLEKVKKKYPVDKSKGKNLKYTEYE